MTRINLCVGLILSITLSTFNNVTQKWWTLRLTSILQFFLKKELEKLPYHSFFTIYFKIYCSIKNYVCVSVFGCVCECGCPGPEGGIGSPGCGISVGWELPDLCVRSKLWPSARAARTCNCWAVSFTQIQLYFILFFKKGIWMLASQASSFSRLVCPRLSSIWNLAEAANTQIPQTKGPFWLQNPFASLSILSAFCSAIQNLISFSHFCPAGRVAVQRTRFRTFQRNFYTSLRL